MAGTTVIEFINYQTFWKLFDQQKQQAANLLAAIVKFSKLTGLGAALIIFSGVAMIALTHGLMAGQLWFKIKMGFVLLLISNGVFNGNKTSAKIRDIVELNAPDQTFQLMLLKDKLKIFYFLQLFILFIIVFLAAYKFN